MSQGDLLETFYSLDDLRASINKFVAQKMSSLSDQILKEIKIRLAMEKVCLLYPNNEIDDTMDRMKVLFSY